MDLQAVYLQLNPQEPQTNPKLNIIENQCPTCGNIDNIIRNCVYVCPKCATEIGYTISSGPDWKVDEAGNYQSRCGLSINPMMLESSYSTYLSSGGPQSKLYRDLQKTLLWDSIPNTERSLKARFDNIETKCRYHDIPTVIIEYAQEHYYKYVCSLSQGEPTRFAQQQGCPLNPSSCSAQQQSCPHIPSSHSAQHSQEDPLIGQLELIEIQPVLNDNISDKTNTKKTPKIPIIRARNNEGLQGATVYQAFVDYGQPKTFTEIAYIFGIDQSYILYWYKKFREVLYHENNIGQSDPIDYIKSFCSKLNLSGPFIVRIQEVYQKSQSIDKLNINFVPSVIASCIWYVVVENALPIKKDLIANRCNVSVATINKIYDILSINAVKLL